MNLISVWLSNTDPSSPRASSVNKGNLGKSA